MPIRYLQRVIHIKISQKYSINMIFFLISSFEVLSHYNYIELWDENEIIIFYDISTNFAFLQICC